VRPADTIATAEGASRRLSWSFRRGHATPPPRHRWHPRREVSSRWYGERCARWPRARLPSGSASATCPTSAGDVAACRPDRPRGIPIGCVRIRAPRRGPLWESRAAPPRHRPTEGSGRRCGSLCRSVRLDVRTRPQWSSVRPWPYRRSSPHPPTWARGFRSCGDRPTSSTTSRRADRPRRARAAWRGRPRWAPDVASARCLTPVPWPPDSGRSSHHRAPARRSSAARRGWASMSARSVKHRSGTLPDARCRCGWSHLWPARRTPARHRWPRRGTGPWSPGRPTSRSWPAIRPRSWRTWPIGVWVGARCRPRAEFTECLDRFGTSGVDQGRPSKPKIHVALGQNGDLQIELIQSTTTRPAMRISWLKNSQAYSTWVGSAPTMRPRSRRPRRELRRATARCVGRCALHILWARRREPAWSPSWSTWTMWAARCSTWSGKKQLARTGPSRCDRWWANPAGSARGCRQ